MLNFNYVLAQDAPSPERTEYSGQQQGSPLSVLPLLAILFFIFYFLILRPQKKKLQEEQALLKSL